MKWARDERPSGAGCEIALRGSDCLRSEVTKTGKQQLESSTWQKTHRTNYTAILLSATSKRDRRIEHNRVRSKPRVGTLLRMLYSPEVPSSLVILTFRGAVLRAILSLESQKGGAFACVSVKPLAPRCVE